MDCTDFDKYLIDYIDENLPSKVRIEMDEHKNTCGHCKRSFQSTKEFLNELCNAFEEKPSEKLAENFYDFLEREKRILNRENVDQSSERKMNRWMFFRYAAEVLLLIGIGFLIGKSLNQHRRIELAELQNEVRALQQQASINSLVVPTASHRLKVINDFSSHPAPDEEILNALIQTLNTDHNVNVRMAAAYSLTKYKDSELVKKALINSLANQKDPMIQVTLIGILVDLNDERIKQPLQNLIENNETQPLVKEHAKSGLQVFI